MFETSPDWEFYYKLRSILFRELWFRISLLENILEFFKVYIDNNLFSNIFLLESLTHYSIGNFIPSHLVFIL